MKYIKVILAGLLLLSVQVLSAQTDRKEVRKGNREYRKGEYREAEIDYRRALVKDSLSVAANYNLACDLYRQDQADEAEKYMKKIEDQAVASGYGADYYYNLGNIALAKEDYGGAVDAYEKSLLLRPEDLDAKENYVYAKLMLKNQQNQQDQQGGDQNQDQNQDNQDQNQDQDRDQDNQNNQDQNQDQKENQDNQDNQDGSQQNPRQQDSKISPQAAQQMLQAIQAREKETQDKVNREKAAALKSRQKEKNW